MNTTTGSPGGPLANANMAVEAEIVVKSPDGKVKQTVKNGKTIFNKGFISRLFKK